MTMHAESVTIVVDPRPEAWPRFDERLVGHLDALCASSQQPRFNEHVDDIAIDRRAFELGIRHLSPRVFGVVTGLDETQEQPLGLESLRWLETVVDPFGGSGDGRGDRSGLAVRVEGQLVVGPAMPRLHQRMRDQRERPGVIVGLGDDGVDQFWCDDEASSLGRFGDDGSKLVLAEWTNDDLSPGEQRSKLGNPGAVTIEVSS